MAAEAGTRKRSYSPSRGSRHPGGTLRKNQEMPSDETVEFVTVCELVEVKK